MTKPIKENIVLSPEQAQKLANEVTEAMWQRDNASQALGMKILEVRPGYAKIKMTIRTDMVNGHHIAHGGFIFTLADTAFAFSCNSYNFNTVASSCNIDYIAPVFEDETIEAEAIERSRSGRTGVYDITISQCDTKKTVALFRGKSYRINGEVIEGLKQANIKK